MPTHDDPIDAEVFGRAWSATLEQAGAYPHDPSAEAGIERIDTAISRLHLTRERVYKWRRPIDLGYLDFRDRRRRVRDCEQEVRLNRRLAPSVYLGIAPLEEGCGGWRIGPTREPRALDAAADAASEPESRLERTEHCVVMRRLPSGGDFASRLEKGRLSTASLAALARRLAWFHRCAAIGDADPDGVRALTLDNLAAIEKVGVARALHGFDDACREIEELLASSLPDLADRAPTFGVDGHGDLRLEHVWQEAATGDEAEGQDRDGLSIIDCAEFEPRFRRLDAAVDLAFLHADLTHRGRGDLARELLGFYVEASDDYGVHLVLDACRVYAHTVRAKVAAIEAKAAERGARRSPALQRCRRHIELARRAVRTHREGAANARVFVVCGPIASGKRRASLHLARANRGTVVSGDRLAGLAPDHLDESMLERAEPVLRSGRTVVLSAPYPRAVQRQRALDWARERGAPAVLVETRCSEDEAVRRLARAASRAGADRAGDEAESEDGIRATRERVRAGRSAFEDIDDLEPPWFHVVHTDRHGWIERLTALARC